MSILTHQLIEDQARSYGDSGTAPSKLVSCPQACAICTLYHWVLSRNVVWIDDCFGSGTSDRHFDSHIKEPKWLLPNTFLYLKIDLNMLLRPGNVRNPTGKLTALPDLIGGHFLAESGTWG